MSWTRKNDSPFVRWRRLNRLIIRMLSLRIVLLLCGMLHLSSCLNQALAIARDPAGVAQAVADQSAQQLVGDDLGTLFSESETNASIERALQDNPDALNGQELRKLRDELETHNMGSNSAPRASSTRQMKFYDRRFEEQRYKPWRVDSQTGIVYDERVEGRIDAPRVALENELPKDRLLRSRDEWRLGQPNQVNLREHDLPAYRHNKRFQPKIYSPEEFEKFQKQQMQERISQQAQALKEQASAPQVPANQ